MYLANSLLVKDLNHLGLTGTAQEGLAIITCMDSWISPLATDVTRIRTYPLLQKGVSVASATYNVSTGQLEPVDC